MVRVEVIEGARHFIMIDQPDRPSMRALSASFQTAARSRERDQMTSTHQPSTPAATCCTCSSPWRVYNRRPVRLHNGDPGVHDRGGLAAYPHRHQRRCIPALYGLHAFIIFFRSMDEFQRAVIADANPHLGWCR